MSGTQIHDHDCCIFLNRKHGRSRTFRIEYLTRSLRGTIFFVIENFPWGGANYVVLWTSCYTNCFEKVLSESYVEVPRISINP